jgi:hypothetical protein
MNGSFIDDLQDISSINQFSGSQARKSTDDGEGDVANDNAERAKPADTFPCESCGGTGVYRGVRLHQPESKCFACGGRGWFKTSYKDRMQARQKSAQRKASAKEVAQDAFKEQHPGLIERLTDLSSWNSFAGTMLQAFGQWNGLTDKQVAACEAMFVKVDAKQAEKAKAREANSGEVDISKIEAMFATAKASGLNKMAFTADGLKIKPAKETSKNAGALYVTLGSYDSYQGKIVGGRFYPVSGVKSDTLTKLNEIAINPSQAARDYGKRTGVCCCCGRELTDKASIEAGIGPICATKWGL